MKDLRKALKSELSGDFEKLILLSLDDPATRNAKSLKEAMDGTGTSEYLLIMVIVSATNAEIAATNAAFHKCALSHYKFVLSFT